MPEVTSQHGRVMQGPATARPNNAFGGQPYYDETAKAMLYWDSEANEWRQMGVAAEADEITMNATLKAIPGALFSRSDSGFLISDGVAELTIAEEPESSSST